MKKLWKQLGRKVMPVLMMVLLLTMTASAEGYSGDNSLAALGVENGTVTPEFEYSTWEYNVTVAPGTTELILNPVPSDPNAQVIDISGTVLGEDGTTTVVITVQAENGDQFPYTLHVTTDQAAAPVNETEAQTEPAPQTETQAPETENAKIKELETKNKLFRSQADEYKEESEMRMKIILGFIAVTVVLIFVIINLLMKIKDSKKDLREFENDIDSYHKKKKDSFDTYYTPQQGRGVPKNITPVNGGNYQEETFRQVENDGAEDKAAARKQARAEKKAAKAEAKAAKKAAKYDDMMGSGAMNRQPAQQQRGNMNIPPMNNQAMNNQAMNNQGMNNQGMRQPQNGMNQAMARQPQQGAPMNGQPMNNSNNSMGGMTGNMGPYVGRQPQQGAASNIPAGQTRQQPSRESSASQEHSKVEIDMIDL